MPARECSSCGKNSVVSEGAVCSACYRKLGKEKPGRKPKHKPKKKRCEFCKQWFQCTTAYQIEKQRFCNRDCRSKWTGQIKQDRTKRIKRKCKNCDQPMEVLPCHEETKWFCSQSCSSTYNHSGERNYWWQGGIAQRGVYWKRKAKVRDGNRCRSCNAKEKRIKKKGKGTKGKTVSNLHGHHVIPVEMGGEHSLENIVTLCIDCHRKTEKEFYTAVIAAVGAKKLQTIRKKLMRGMRVAKSS